MRNRLSKQDAALLAKQLRRIGMARVLYGTDSAQGGNLRPRAAWAAFRRLPLSEAEFAQVAANVPPYFRQVWHRGHAAALTL